MTSPLSFTEHEIDGRWLADIDRHRLRLSLSFGMPRRDRVRAWWHTVDLVVSVFARDRKERVRQHDDVGFHLWMDATELHVDARRLRTLAEHVLFCLVLRPRAEVVLLVVGREHVVWRWIAVQETHGRSSDDREHMGNELHRTLVHVGGL